MPQFIRKHLYDTLWKNLQGKTHLIQAVVGPRQVGKTTLALQIFDQWPGFKSFESADNPDTPSSDWIRLKWEEARIGVKGQKKAGLFIIDEIQKIPRWSQVVKALFDEDKRKGIELRVVLLGSSALLVQKGLTESLAGRFELHQHMQWSYEECKECFGLSLDEYLYFGGYPGALVMRHDENRWRNFFRGSLIETVLSKDVLLMATVTKPALLRQAFGLATASPAKILSYQKMMGSLQDAGNTTTIATYLGLLSKAFLMTNLERLSGSAIRQRGSIPKIVILDNGLVSAMSGLKFGEARKDSVHWGNCVENIVGARLYYFAEEMGGQVFYWRERQHEVDYVLKIGKKIIGIEVKTNADKAPASFNEFIHKFKPEKVFTIYYRQESSKQVKEGLISLDDFLLNPDIVI